MKTQTLHILKFVTAIIGQTILLAAAWGFLSAVFIDNPLYVPDSFANLMFSRLIETTWVVTPVATVVSVATTTYSFKS